MSIDLDDVDGEGHVGLELVEEADLPSVRIHDLRHTWASQGVMNGVGLPTVGRLLDHKRRTTTTIYAHLDDATLQNAAAVIAKAMGFKVQGQAAASASQCGSI